MKLCAAEISGATGNGLYVMLKHFALNDQETYRGGWGYASNNGVYTWADEQTVREIYLRAFEIPVKEAECSVKYISDNNGTISQKTIRACTGLMTSFNAVGSTWAGANSDLLTEVVRNEWNFDGVVITDFKNDGRKYMDLDAMINAGGDIALATVPNIAEGEEALEISHKDSGSTLQAMRQACKHILYTTVYSNAMNGIKPGTIISYTLAPWQIFLIIMSIVVYGFALFIVVMLVLRMIDTRKHPEKYKS